MKEKKEYVIPQEKVVAYVACRALPVSRPEQRRREQLIAVTIPRPYLFAFFALVAQEKDK